MTTSDRITPNRLARYVGEGRVEIVTEPLPNTPTGGLRVRTEASGLCSGELMAWYMDRKLPHVLGHEMAGIVEESEDGRFPVGSRVFVHHHAPCLHCDFCRRADYVHCETWRSTRLNPGGMAERYVATAAHLTDTLRVDDLRPRDAALIEPLACVVKSLRQVPDSAESVAVIGLGVMGLMHLLMRPDAQGYDLNPARIQWAREQELRAAEPATNRRYDAVVVCPGSQAAFDFAMEIVRTGGVIVMFAPLPPDAPLIIPDRAYFGDIAIRNSYSCGPADTAAAATAIRQGRIRAEQAVSDFITLDQLPEAYVRMRDGRILKAMVEFP